MNAQSKVLACLSLLVVIGFFVRAVPHLFFIPMWSPEEEYNYQIVNQLYTLGQTTQLGTYPVLGHLTVYALHLVTQINPVLISQYFNPMFGALTLIPLFLLVRKISNEKVALVSSIFWAFSEAVFYRSAIFSSTEMFAFFITTCILYLYVNKKYVPAILLIPLVFYTHLLPAFFISLVIFLHQFIIRSKKIKLLMTVPFASVIIFLLSPLNPHQRMLSVIDPAVLLSHFSVSNVSIYSLNDLSFGITIFLGTLILGALTVVSLIKYKTQNTFIFTMLLAATLLFIFSWIVYSPSVFAPPRLTFYFIVPFIFYASLLITKFNISGIRMPYIWTYAVIGSIVLMMVMSSVCGAQTMLFYQNSVTKEEYKALDDLIALNVFTINPGYWWSDYPVRISITAITTITSPNISPTLAVNESRNINSSMQLADQNATLNPDTIYRYVFFSERMEQESFFTVFTYNRTLQVRQPLHDVWVNSTMWTLIYQDHGVTVYERKIS